VVFEVSAANRRGLQDTDGDQRRKAWRIVIWLLCGAFVTLFYVLVVHIIAEDSVDRFTYALPGYMFMFLFLILANLHYFTGVRGAKKQDRQ
jgi:hypothetical protein